MHKSRRTNRRFARVTEIQVTAQVVAELLRKRKGQFVEQIMRMLSIVQWPVVPRFAALQQKRITAAAFGQLIQTRHESPANLRCVAKRMRIYRHDAIRRIDTIVASARSQVGVAWKN